MGRPKKPMEEIADLPGEVWKPISGYEGLYEVSNMGRVKSVERDLPHKTYGTWHIRERILKPYWAGKKKNGQYLAVWLHCGHGVQRTYRVHRLVAEAFIEKVPGKDFVNHIDCDRSNNAVSNLEWCTLQENTAHAFANGRCENVCKCHEVPVVNVETGEVFRSLKLASEKYGVTGGAISRALRGKAKTSCGYHWKYAG